MTKVTSINVGKRAGKSVPAPETKSGGKGTIVATRAGATRTFTQTIWDHLPPDKEGWILSTAKPKDLATNNPPPAKTPEQIAYDQAVEAYKAKFQKDPATNLSTEQILEEINSADDDDEFDLVVTQEYLDTHPEVAAQGVKVGDTIKTKED